MPSKVPGETNLFTGFQDIPIHLLKQIYMLLLSHWRVPIFAFLHCLLSRQLPAASCTNSFTSEEDSVVAGLPAQWSEWRAADLCQWSRFACSFVGLEKKNQVIKHMRLRAVKCGNNSQLSRDTISDHSILIAPIIHI